MKKSMSLEELQRLDHDTIVRLESKVDGLIVDVKELKDGTTAKIIDLDIRVKAVEKVVIETDLLNSYKDYIVLKQKVHDFVTTANAYRLVGGLLGGIIVFILTQLPNWIKLLWR